jgi:hypothetical protein
MHRNIKLNTLHSKTVLIAQMKIREENTPIIPLGNFYTPAHKLAKFVSTKLSDILQLWNTFITSDFAQLALTLNNLKINITNRLITHATKDIYLNPPVTKTLHINKTPLNFNKVENIVTQQIILQLRMILL